MHPILLQLGPITIYAFGVALAAAFLGGTWVAQQTMRHARRLGATVTLTSAQVTDLIFWMLVGGVLGARMLYLAAHWDHYRQAPWEIFAIWHGGLIFYGGFFAAMGAAWWYLRRQRMPITQMLDLLTPMFAVGQSIGRIGCFLNGCCYGRPTTGPWGVTFPWSVVPLYPTQLMESAVMLLMAVGFGAWLWFRRPWERPPHGRVALACVVLYATWRFGVEFLRADNPVIAAGLNLPQWLSLGLLAVSAVWWRRLRRTARG